MDNPRNKEDEQVKKNDAGSEDSCVLPEVPFGSVSVGDGAIVVFKIVFTGQ
jgi:hypothetical protein